MRAYPEYRTIQGGGGNALTRLEKQLLWLTALFVLALFGMGAWCLYHYLPIYATAAEVMEGVAR